MDPHVRDLEEALDEMNAKRDVMGFSFVTALADLEDEENEHGWGQAPCLYVVYRDLLHPEPVAEDDDNVPGMMVLSARRIGLPLPQGSEEDLVTCLRALSDGLQDHQVQVPRNIFGWALFVEGFEVDPASQGAAQGSVEQQEAGRMPERVETRLVVAIDCAGVLYRLYRRSDQTERALDCQQHATQTPGELPDELRKLMDATL